MARPLRLEYPGAVYHVTARGDRRGWIVLDDVDRRTFLERLGRAVERYNWTLYAYCLMGNHYHLLVETPDANLSRGMQWLNGVYTQNFNRRHGRVGHVFQGRYKAILVEREAYLLELCRYIDLNPVRAHLVLDAEEWQWSSYRATRCLDAAPGWLAVDQILALFGAGDTLSRASAYGEFVRQGVHMRSPWEGLSDQLFLGSEAFVERHRNRIPEDLDEVVGRPARPPAPRLEYLADRHSRDEAITLAWSSGGYTLKAIGDYFGLHYSRISRIVSGGAKGKI
ncbi:toxin RelE [Thioalkalivibrio versutus]|uniref:Toxin RelE n=1 Tax=Thioalkalivibrio versutus TaxID=106634 RepID=A0A0G3G3A1_9GAMM|nr:transposase [Thioalkalivibrio versutus]AKJ95660.1 toxin RelE [Thioalkalivibrio versutus]